MTNQELKLLAERAHAARYAFPKFGGPDPLNEYLKAVRDPKTVLDLLSQIEESQRQEWTVNDSREFYGQEVQSWKSKTGQWAFGYGTWLSGVVALETLVTGFDSEEAAFEAAHKHCYESAVENAADAPEETLS